MRKSLIWNNAMNNIGKHEDGFRASFFRLEEEVVNGDVRSRARYFSYAGTYIVASIFATKGVDKVGKMGKAGKMSSKADVPYNVMTTANIKSFIHDGVKSTFGKVEDTAHQLLSSRTGKRALGLNSFSGHLQELFRKTKHVLNPGKVKSVMEKTYQKVVAGPVSKVAQSEAFSRMGKVLLNEDGHVVVSGKNRVHVEKINDKGTGEREKQEIVKFTDEQLSTKPPYSRDPEKWQTKGGKIEINDEGIWTYINWGNPPIRVSYPGGFPDFKSAGLVRQEVSIGDNNRYDLDFARADELAPRRSKLDENTWHHHQDLTTMQKRSTEDFDIWVECH
ncbi:HNH endonuclease [Rossellomorea vietnamensis]|uniref:HNH endonuclease n=1 Tax=Rossellomorea vietnamensis TaxID=218284 RepID=UPI001E4401AB|nr:HNH endonuclease [Rossellomorea vietnamensis]